MELILIDLEEITKDSLPGISFHSTQLIHQGKLIVQMEVTEGYWKDRTYQFQITFPSCYPYYWPRILLWKTSKRIYHPDIDRNPNVVSLSCWGPDPGIACPLKTVLLNLQQMLQENDKLPEMPKGFRELVNCSFMHEDEPENEFSQHMEALCETADAILLDDGFASLPLLRKEDLVSANYEVRKLIILSKAALGVLNQRQWKK
jgi:ubiquitin-protein ligase